MKTEEILHKHNLVRTSCRQSIIDTIAKSGHAISEEEIKKKVEATYDRTTFYRSLKTLIEKNIIHKIVVDNQLVKYALNEGSRENNHVHFFCNSCEVVECLPGIDLGEELLPEGYKQVETELVIKGFCNKCNR
jgi:Fur family ferric uptake transcriptional regulator